MEPTYKNIMQVFEKNLRTLINQPIREFQENNQVHITEVKVDLIDVSVCGGDKKSIVNRVIISYTTSE